MDQQTGIPSAPPLPDGCVWSRSRGRLTPWRRGRFVDPLVEDICPGRLSMLLHIKPSGRPAMERGSCKTGSGYSQMTNPELQEPSHDGITPTHDRRDAVTQLCVRNPAQLRASHFRTGTI